MTLEQPLTVVVADDDPIDRAETKALLLRGSTRRFAFREAETAHEALDACADSPPDCLVLDHLLPDANALEVLADLPRDEYGPSIPIVVVTGAPTPDLNRRLLRAGAQEFVGKDWLTADSLTRSVENAIERHRRARRLAHSEELRQSLMEGTPDAVAVLDLHGRIRSVNGPGRAWMEGAQGAPVEGTRWTELWPPERRAPLESAIARARSGAVATLELQGPSADDPRWWAITSSPVRSRPEDSVRRLLVIARDISERKASEEARAANERQLRQLAEAGASITIVLQADGRPGFANSQYARFFGRSLEEAAANEWADILHPEERDEVLARWRAALATGTPYEAEQRLIRRDGAARWHLVRVVPVEEPDGALTAWYVTLTDIHELKESARRKDEFLAMLGHELRNPLAAIASAAEVIRLQSADDRRWRRVHDVLSRQTAHMTGIIDGLLDVSRIERGKITLERRPLELSALLRSALADREADARRRGIELTAELTASPCWVSGDEIRLAQVFDNLLTNALKFTDRGGRVTLRLSGAGPWARAEVVDTGVGLRAELIPYLFQPFQQERQNIARSSGGLGLGLALVRGLVELHGGHVEAESEGPGRGATFRVRLPLGEPPPEPPARERPAPARPLRVLLAEDNEDARTMIAELLGGRGHAVVSVPDGEQALERLQRESFDVLLSDIGLPGIDGLELARRARALPSLRDLRMVAITGYGQENDRRRCLEAGFDAHLVKPVATPELEALLAPTENGAMDGPRSAQRRSCRS